MKKAHKEFSEKTQHLGHRYKHKQCLSVIKTLGYLITTLFLHLHSHLQFLIWDIYLHIFLMYHNPEMHLNRQKPWTEKIKHNCRITEWLRLEGTCGRHPAQPLLSPPPKKSILFFFKNRKTHRTNSFELNKSEEMTRTEVLTPMVVQQ